MMNEEDRTTLDTFLRSLTLDSSNALAGTAGTLLGVASMVGVYTPSSFDEALTAYGREILSAGIMMGVLGYVLGSVYDRE